MSRSANLTNATVRLTATSQEGGFVSTQANISASGSSSAHADAVVYAADPDPARLKFAPKDTIYLGGYLNDKPAPSPFPYLAVGSSPMSWSLPVLHPTQVDWIDVPATFSFVKASKTN